ncbi:MAG: hypothetical protein RSD74_02045 [Angelakisella sp.]
MSEIEKTIENLNNKGCYMSIDYSGGKDMTAVILIGEQAELAIIALQEKAERDNPKPLTLDELRWMDGEAVFLVDAESLEYGWHDGWYLVDTDCETVYTNCATFGFTQIIGLAYRYKPKEG